MPGVAVRTVPSSYVPGNTLTVSITITPDGGTIAYALEDAPPTGWVVSNIQQDSGSPTGVFDGIAGKVKWIPFSGDTPHTISYDVTPPISETGTQSFNGVGAYPDIVPIIDSETGSPTTEITEGAGDISFPGDVFTQDEPLDPVTGNRNSPVPDFKMSISEAVSYLVAWLTSDPWPENKDLSVVYKKDNLLDDPDLIPISFAVWAFVLFLQNDGFYHFTGNVNSGGPNTANPDGFTVPQDAWVTGAATTIPPGP